MAEADTKTPTLSEHYLLKGKDGTSEVTNPVEKADVKTPVTTTVEEVVDQKTDESPAVVESSDVPPAAATGESFEAAATDASTEDTPAAEAASGDDSPAGEETNESSETEATGDQEATEDTSEIKLETAPADFRFPTTNQTRHCFTRYVEFHRCIAAKGDDAPECQKFAKYYRSLCPGEWIDRWNEQRENGTFPGPL